MSENLAPIRVVKLERRDSRTRRFTVTSAADARRRYIILNKGKSWKCSCPVWKFRRKVCKHIQKVKGGRR